jgi:hypothetical protein
MLHKYMMTYTDSVLYNDVVKYCDMMDESQNSMPRKDTRYSATAGEQHAITLVSATIDMHTKTEELLETVFSVGSAPLLYKDSSFKLPPWVRCETVASQ